MSDATHLAAAIRGGERSAVESIEEALRRIEEANPRLNIFTDITRERALREARAIDQGVRRGPDPGPLAGVPCAVKNLFDVSGMVTRAGSRINLRNRPARADATAVARLTAAGAVLVGTTNMDEFAYGYTTENGHYGGTRNPHDPQRIAGGSSGGSAAAVAAGLAPIALGTDTNGSIRVPAALCGVFGLKPTFGRVSRAGVFPFVDTLDHAGPLAGTLQDLAIVYDVLQGYDPRDPVSANRAVEPVSGHIGTVTGTLRCAEATGYFAEGLTTPVRQLMERARDILQPIGNVVIPEAATARSAAFVITASESGQLHRPGLKEHADEYGPLVRNRLLAGALVPAHWYLQAQEFRRWYRQAFDRLFATVDVILAPATPCSATLIGQETMMLDGRQVPVRTEIGRFVQPLTLTGLPILTVPARASDGLPAGIQLIGRRWGERDLFRAGLLLVEAGFTEI